MTDTDKTEEPGRDTRSKALQDSVICSADRTDRRRDALRRFAGNPDVDDIDLDRLEAPRAGERDGAEFPKEADVAPPETGGEMGIISGPHSVRGLNASAADRQMEFSDDGIVIVCGDDGSEKSGRCRGPKHARRTRDGKFAIHPDIDGTDEPPRSSEIGYRVGFVSRTISARA